MFLSLLIISNMSTRAGSWCLEHVFSISHRLPAAACVCLFVSLSPLTIIKELNAYFSNISFYNKEEFSKKKK
jgi:hypothetical protein